MRAGQAIDTELWEAVYREHAARLTRLATALVGADGAHDLVADAVLACIRRPGWHEVEQPGAYLTRALVNAAHALRRSESSRRRRELRVASPMDATTADAAPDPTLHAALDHLSPQQAAIVFHLYWEDLTVPATARLLGLSEGTVRKQLDRAKRRLRKVIPDDAHR